MNRLSSYFLIAAISGLALASNGAFARGGFGHHGHGGFGGKYSMDADGDGVVTLEEFVAPHTERGEFRFARLDQNDDGVISADEHESTDNDHHFRGRHDGITLDTAAFEQCMRDQLGDEFQTRPTWEELLASADTNADGVLDLNEFLAHGYAREVARFEALDTNADGGVDSDEQEAGLVKKQTHHLARRTCMMEQWELANP